MVHCILVYLPQWRRVADPASTMIEAGLSTSATARALAADPYDYLLFLATISCFLVRLSWIDLFLYDYDYEVFAMS